MKNRLITQMRIRAIAHDKFTVKVTYTDGNSIITAGCDDYIAVAQASVWIANIGECISSENSHRLTIQKTIDDFWKDYYDEE
jgi:hypothetical protein